MENNQLLKFGVDVRTLKGVGRTDLLAKELITTDITLCGITETDLPGAGIMDLDEDSCYRLLFSGPPELASTGVGLVFRCNVLKSLKSFDPTSGFSLQRGSVALRHAPAGVGHAQKQWIGVQSRTDKEFFENSILLKHNTTFLSIGDNSHNLSFYKVMSGDNLVSNVRTSVDCSPRCTASDSIWMPSSDPKS